MAALCVGSAGAATAPPGLGNPVIAQGGDIVVDPQPAEASFRSELWLVSPGPAQFIALNERMGDPEQAPVNIGSFAPGTELIFAIRVEGTQEWRTGPGSRNDDGEAHAVVTSTPDGVHVGFEDLRITRDSVGEYIGDIDFDDNVFGFSGGVRTEPQGDFTCRAQGAKLPLLGAQAIANGPNNPCATASKSVVKVTVGAPGLGVTANVINGRTTAAADSANASADLASLNINVTGLTVSATGAATTARAVCGPNGLELSGTAKLASATVLGVTLDPTVSATIDIGLARVSLNSVTRVGDEIISRALVVDLPGTALDVVVAESRAGATGGDPCPV